MYGGLCKWVWTLPKESLVEEAVYPDEAFFWDNKEDSEGSCEKDGAGAEKVGGRKQGTPTSSSFDGMEVDIVLAKTDEKK